MSCNSCQSKFSFFTRENGCPNCGFSYCNKCLKYKCQLPDDNLRKVCGPCYNKLISNSHNILKNSSNDELPSSGASNTPIAPVDIQYNMNTLDNPVRPSLAVYEQGQWDRFKAGMDPADQAIVDRLKKLRAEDKQQTSLTTTEIRRRLASLRDEDPDRVVITNIHQVDTRSDQEKSEDLIRKYVETLELSSTNSSVEDMEMRLNALKGIHPQKSSTVLVDDDDDDDDDEEAITKNIIDKAIAEAALEAKYDDKIFEKIDVEPTKEHSDEDSACVMCEQSKDLVQCTGCTGDLYCLICFNDNHDSLEMKKHKAILFQNRRRVPY